MRACTSDSAHVSMHALIIQEVGYLQTWVTNSRLGACRTWSSILDTRSARQETCARSRDAQSRANRQGHLNFAVQTSYHTVYSADVENNLFTIGQ